MAAHARRVKTSSSTPLRAAHFQVTATRLDMTPPWAPTQVRNSFSSSGTKNSGTGKGPLLGKREENRRPQRQRHAPTEVDSLPIHWSTLSNSAWASWTTPAIRLQHFPPTRD